MVCPHNDEFREGGKQYEGQIGLNNTELSMNNEKTNTNTNARAQYNIKNTVEIKIT